MRRVSSNVEFKNELMFLIYIYYFKNQLTQLRRFRILKLRKTANRSFTT